MQELWQNIAADPKAQKAKGQNAEGVLDLLIIGAGVSGMAAALEAEKKGLSYKLLEASEPFNTIANFPKGKPIYTYPTDMVPAGDLQFRADVKEPLLENLHEDTKGIEVTKLRAERVKKSGAVLEVECEGGRSLKAHRVIVAIGRSGNFRKLGVEGENLDKVYNRLHDPKDFCGKDVLVVGGGDSALETAIALAQCGCNVTVSYRKKEFSRPKPDNIERLEALLLDPMADVEVDTPTSERVTTASGAFLGKHRKAGSIRLLMASSLKQIRDEQVQIETESGELETIKNDVVFSMIGREAPLDFFRRSGIKISGETVGLEWLGIILFFIAIWLVYDWKGEGFIFKHLPYFSQHDVFPNNVPDLLSSIGAAWQAKVSDRSTLIGTLAVSMKGRSFYYTLIYTLTIFVFGIRRIRRRKTPYVTLQTATLFLVQLIPLFLLPEIVLPWLGYNGAFDSVLERCLLTGFLRNTFRMQII